VGGLSYGDFAIPFWGLFPLFRLTQMLSISPTLLGFQGDCKVTAEKTGEGKEGRY
jgi:hypothetical protein